MKIGMNMLLWTDHVAEQHFPIIEKLKETGFDGIEMPLGTGDISHYTSIGNHLSDLGLLCTAVTSLTEESNIASDNEKYRQAGLDHLKWAIDVAHAAKADVVCGPFHSAFAYFSRKPPTDDEKKRSIEVLRKASEYAAQANIQLAIEALNRFECYLVNTMADAKALVKEIDHPNIGVLFDTHHANIEEKNQKEAIHEVTDHIKHVHISENDRGTPGEGQVNWDDAFSGLKEIGYDGWLTLEAFSRNAPEFANAINVWRDFSASVEIYQKGFEFIKRKWNQL